MAKHVHRKLTPAEKKRSREARAALEAEKDEIIAKGQAFFERHERLRGVVAMLKDLRESKGISLAELAEQTGMSKSSLSRLENERSCNPTIETLEKIADALGAELEIRLVMRKAA